MDLAILSAEPWHATILAPRLREADRREVWASSGLGPEFAIRRSIEGSVVAWTAFVDGDPACIWGCGPAATMSDEGVVWLLGAEEIDRYPLRFLRETVRFADGMLDLFSALRNFVDVRNDVSIRWLTWLGAEFGEPRPHGFAGLPFRPFVLRRGRGLLRHRRPETEPQEAA